MALLKRNPETIVNLAAVAKMQQTPKGTRCKASDNEEPVLEADEEPDEHMRNRTSTEMVRDAAFMKSLPPQFMRRESLLTRQLHSSEPESYTEDEHHSSRSIMRGTSTSSNRSVASTAELTSDNDLTSPMTRDSTPSPQLQPTHMLGPVSTLDKTISEEPEIVSDDQVQNPVQAAEKGVEAGLGRRRCITFACGRRSASPQPKVETRTTAQQVQKPSTEISGEPPKRKCALTFACPSKTSDLSPALQERRRARRQPSPLPPTARIPIIRAPASPRQVIKPHRGSDTTIKNESPKTVRKVPSRSRIHRRKYSADIDDSLAEARRFHEFGTTADIQEEWVQEVTCHRSRLTVNDTLEKENIIRKLGEEAEEEALEEDEEEDLDLPEEDPDDDDDGALTTEYDDVDDEDEQDAVSDAGFDTDDEEGFAVSDSENEDDSDTEWWAPGRSTAATSTDHLEHIRPIRSRTLSDSSSEESGRELGMSRKIKRKTRAIKIHRPGTPDLPDSTDFVCGTLDEDRPLEQAYIQCREQKKAARAKITPQDIDPTFPTSDPEMDEEDDDDEDMEPEESDANLFMHGNLDLHKEEPLRRGRRVSSPPARKKSPLPHSPRRMRSPAPIQRIGHRSPAPTQRIALRSPAPTARRPTLRSPPPDVKRNHRAKSPAPVRRLFGQSPRRRGSPAPGAHRMTSPAPSRRTSTDGTPSQAITMAPNTLAQRPQPTHTASLPRGATANVTAHAKRSTRYDVEDEQDPADYRTTRGAIDIVKGLEKKRQRRKEKLYQKHINDKKAGKERERKPKPGKGAERMREVGLELAAYKGKKEHMLSY